MANAYRVTAGLNVSYFNGVKWLAAKITSVVSQTSCVLAVCNANGSRTALNSGTAVAKRTAHGQTNVWRPY